MKKLTSFLQKPQEQITQIRTLNRSVIELCWCSSYTIKSTHYIDSLHLVEIVAGQTNCSVYSRSQRLVFVEKFNFSQSEEKKTCDRLRAVQTQYTDATKLCFKNQSKQKLPKKVQVLRRKIS